LFIGDRDHRNQEGLCHWLSLAPTLGGRRIAIIDEADYFNEESANALLKTLEEPPRRALILLIGTTAKGQLPTIRSRCQIVRFRPLDLETVAALLLQDGAAHDRRQAVELAQQSTGSLTRARVMANEEMLRFRERLFVWLAAPMLESVEVSRAVREFVESAGTEARVRRERLRVVLSLAADYYRAEMRSLAGGEVACEGAVRQFAEGAPDEVPGIEIAVDRCLRRLDRCFEGILDLEKNANQSTLIDCWLDELARA
jgi:DNA polymerase-3 subunit delta'